MLGDILDGSQSFIKVTYLGLVLITLAILFIQHKFKLSTIMKCVICLRPFGTYLTKLPSIEAWPQANKTFHYTRKFEYVLDVYIKLKCLRRLCLSILFFRFLNIVKYC